MQQRMSSMDERPAEIDLGTIQGDYSIISNNFPKVIPASDYLVCRGITFGETDSVITKTVDEEHEVKLPEKMRSAKPGDRVLLVWVANDVVVIDILKPASELGG